MLQNQIIHIISKYVIKDIIIQIQCYQIIRIKTIIFCFILFICKQTHKHNTITDQSRVVANKQNKQSTKAITLCFTQLLISDTPYTNTQ